MFGPCPPSVFAMRIMALQPGEPSGDAAACHELPPPEGGRLLAIVDGLGHGQPAAQAAQAALELVAQRPQLPLQALLAALDEHLASTRGAAIGLARVQGRRLLYAGVGNTRAVRWRGSLMTRLSSRWGIVGGGRPLSVEVVELDLQPGDWLLLYTDGLDEMISLPAHLPEWDRDPGLLCEHLLEHWRSVRDDAGVLALRVGED